MTGRERVSDLHRQAREDYGTPEEHAARQDDARTAGDNARSHAQEAAGAERGPQ